VVWFGGSESGKAALKNKVDLGWPPLEHQGLDFRAHHMEKTSDLLSEVAWKDLSVKILQGDRGF
jgi:hypothetical protein